MPKTVLCADIGTTSLKAGLFTASGEAVFLCRKSFENPDDRFVAGHWLFALADCIKKIKDSYDEKGFALWGSNPLSAKNGIKSGGAASSSAKKELPELCGICISGAGPSIVLQNALTFRWNENAPQIQDAPEQVKKSLFLSRIKAVQKSFPSDFDNSAYVFSAPEFLLYQLTKKAVTILPEARFEAAYWTQEACLAAGVDFARLPPFVQIGANVGKLCKESAVLLGLPAGIPVFAGAPDFVVALIGTNTLKSGRLCDRAGSSEGFNFCTEKPFFTPATRTLPSVIPGLWNVSVLSTESGRIFVEYKHRLQKELGKSLDYGALVEEIVKNPGGEGFKILLSILEQVKNSVESLKSALKEHGIALPPSMAVTGGQAKNDLWMQKKADALGMPLEICNCADSELTGDACAAWFGLGKYRSLQDAAEKMVRVTRRFTPHENL